MPEISDDDLKEFQSLRSRVVGMELDSAKATFRADNPHVPAALVNAYQGDPAGLGDYGKVLLEQFPKPQVVPPAASQTDSQPPAAPATPPPAQQLPAAPPPPATPPIMAAQLPVPQTPEAQRAAYMAAQANGGVPPTNVPPAPVPAPGSADHLPLGDATKQQSEQIREKMRIGRATPQEVQWLSQYGEKGFVNAMTTHARRVASTVGRAN